MPPSGATLAATAARSASTWPPARARANAARLSAANGVPAAGQQAWSAQR